MRDIGFFSRKPRRLWKLVRVGATINDRGHTFAKALLNLLSHYRSALVFDHVVEQSGDRFISSAP